MPAREQRTSEEEERVALVQERGDGAAAGPKRVTQLGVRRQVVGEFRELEDELRRRPAQQRERLLREAMPG